MKKSEINFEVNLDVNHIPEKITWKASDSEQADPAECKAVMMSIWEGDSQNTLKIDLWTKDMMIDEMQKFYHQTFLSMADAFERATGEKEICEDLRAFSKYFAEKMKLIDPPKDAE
jgi:gliding motility-associated protein GldC